MPFIQRLGLQGLLSFPPGMEPFDLQPLNVLIGPNGSGKTNLIEAFELLRATPTDFAAAIRAGGGASEWLWKGEDPARMAKMDVEIDGEATPSGAPLRYRLEFTSTNNRVEVLDEVVEDVSSEPGHGSSPVYVAGILRPALSQSREPRFYYRFREGPMVLGGSMTHGDPRHLDMLPGRLLASDQSVLKQLQDPVGYPEITSLGCEFGLISTFREWMFGPSSGSRTPQRADDPPDELLPDARNLALILNEIRHRDDRAFDAAMKRFLPRYDRISSRIIGNAIQLYFHEQGLRDPIPATRVSDGTLRFLAMLVALHAPTPPSLLCIEEPELGMHPDAVALLAELLVEASGRMQLVVTTHSDALLSGLGDKVESVLVCENNGHGTTIDRLDAERLAFWLKDYTLGDIWRIGEIGGNP